MQYLLTQEEYERFNKMAAQSDPEARQKLVNRIVQFTFEVTDMINRHTVPTERSDLFASEYCELAKKFAEECGMSQEQFMMLYRNAKLKRQQTQ